MNEKLKVIVYGIKVKLSRDEKLEDILANYTKLSKEEKNFIRNEINKKTNALGV